MLLDRTCARFLSSCASLRLSFCCSSSLQLNPIHKPTALTSRPNSVQLYPPPSQLHKLQPHSLTTIPTYSSQPNPISEPHHNPPTALIHLYQHKPLCPLLQSTYGPTSASRDPRSSLGLSFTPCPQRPQGAVGPSGSEQGVEGSPLLY